MAWHSGAAIGKMRIQVPFENNFPKYFRENSAQSLIALDTVVHGASGDYTSPLASNKEKMRPTLQQTPVDKSSYLKPQSLSQERVSRHSQGNSVAVAAQDMLDTSPPAIVCLAGSRRTFRKHCTSIGYHAESPPLSKNHESVPADHVIRWCGCKQPPPQL
jgi:hypothetical protein